MAVTVQTQPFSRDDLIRFMPNFRLVKTLENLAQDVSNTLPEAIDGNAEAVEIAQATADAAIVQAAAAQADADAAQQDIDALALRDVPLSLVDAPVIAVDASAHNSFNVTLGGNRTLGAPTGLADGMLLNFAIRQPGGGGPWTLAFNAIYDFGADGTPTLSTAASVVDYVMGYYDAASNKILASFRKGGAADLGASFSAHNNGVAQSIPNSAFTTLSMTTEAFDVGGFFAANTWTPPAGKPVLISGGVTIATTGGVLATVAVYKNGAAFKRGAMQQPQGTGPVTCVVSCIDMPNGTDAYTLRAYQSTVGAQNTSGAADLTYFQGTTLRP